MSKLNLLIVSVNYNDYLSYTLKYNQPVFDNIYVVSSSRDQSISKTIDSLDDHSNIHLLLTEAFYQGGQWGSSIFNKGGGINYGLSQIPNKDWILIGDADCIYPQRLRGIFNNLKKTNLHCMYRKMVSSPTILPEMVHVMNNEKPSDVSPEQFKNQENRSVHYFPGYCQLFNFDADVFKDKKVVYPEGRSCRYIDTIFSRGTFTRPFRTLLHEFYCLHLGKTCVNWYGRKSEEFV